MFSRLDTIHGVTDGWTGGQTRCRSKGRNPAGAHGRNECRPIVFTIINVQSVHYIAISSVARECPFGQNRVS